MRALAIVAFPFGVIIPWMNMFAYLLMSLIKRSDRCSILQFLMMSTNFSAHFYSHEGGIYQPFDIREIQIENVSLSHRSSQLYNQTYAPTGTIR